MLKNITLDGFIEFSGKQTGAFSYFDNDNCALGQYLKSEGHTGVFVGGTCIIPGGFDQDALDEYRAFSLDDNDESNGESTDKVTTFGDLIGLSQEKFVDFARALHCRKWSSLHESLVNIRNRK